MSEHDVLGAVQHQPSDEMKTFLLPDDSLVSLISFESSELCAVCPVTNQPDIYKCTIHYDPRAAAIETKSLKMYLWSWRDRGIFAEHLADQIARDIMSVTNANYVTVVLEQNVRGGIKTTVHADLWKHARTEPMTHEHIAEATC